MTDAFEDRVPEDSLAPEERDPEAPTADAVEQATLADPSAEPDRAVHRGLEVNEYDAIEQAHSVDLEDDYR
jgi:hypothetical protein